MIMYGLEGQPFASTLLHWLHTFDGHSCKDEQSQVRVDRLDLDLLTWNRCSVELLSLSECIIGYNGFKKTH